MHADESRSTFMFASRAKKITMRPKVNEVSSTHTRPPIYPLHHHRQAIGTPTCLPSFPKASFLSRSWACCACLHRVAVGWAGMRDAQFMDDRAIIRKLQRELAELKKKDSPSAAFREVGRCVERGRDPLSAEWERGEGRKGSGKEACHPCATQPWTGSCVGW